MFFAWGCNDFCNGGDDFCKYHKISRDAFCDAFFKNYNAFWNRIPKNTFFQGFLRFFGGSKRARRRQPNEQLSESERWEGVVLAIGR